MKFLGNIVAIQKKQFSPDFFNEEACRLWLLKNLHPKGAYCPRCGKKIDSEKGLKNFWELRKVCCKHCKKSFTATVDTPLNSIHFDMRKIFAMVFFIGLGLSRKEISAMLGTSDEGVRQWEKRLEGWKELAAGK